MVDLGLQRCQMAVVSGVSTLGAPCGSLETAVQGSGSCFACCD